jgi:hypothetical protein
MMTNVDVNADLDGVYKRNILFITIRDSSQIQFCVKSFYFTLLPIMHAHHHHRFVFLLQFGNLPLSNNNNGQCKVLLLQIQLIHKCVVLWMIEEEPWDYIIIIDIWVLLLNHLRMELEKLSSFLHIISTLIKQTLLHGRVFS